MRQARVAWSTICAAQRHASAHVPVSARPPAISSASCAWWLKCVGRFARASYRDWWRTHSAQAKDVQPRPPAQRCDQQSRAQQVSQPQARSFKPPMSSLCLGGPCACTCALAMTSCVRTSPPCAQCQPCKAICVHLVMVSRSCTQVLDATSCLSTLQICYGHTHTHR